MQVPIEVTFRDMTPSPALDLKVREWVGKLEHVVPIQRCTVVVETPHKHQRHGTPFQIHLSIAIPGHQVTVTRGARAEYQDPYLAVSDAFRAARRELLAFVEQRRDARPSV